MKIQSIPFILFALGSSIAGAQISAPTSGGISYPAYPAGPGLLMDSPAVAPGDDCAFGGSRYGDCCAESGE